MYPSRKEGRAGKVRPAAQSPLSAVGDGDVSIAALTSGAHGASFRRAGFRDERRSLQRTPVAAIVHYFVHFVSTLEIKKNNSRGRTLGAPSRRRRKLCDPLKKEKDRPLESTAFVIYNAAVRLSRGRPPRFRRRPCRPGVRRLSPLGAAGSENRPYPLSVLKSYNERARMASAARACKR